MVFLIQHTSHANNPPSKDFAQHRCGAANPALPMLATQAFPLIILMIPNWGAMKAPHFDLDSWFALCAYFITETGGTTGAAIVGIVLLVLLISRAGMSGRQRLVETVVVAGFLLLLACGGAALNEYVLKPKFKHPRPNIVYLSGGDGSGPLKMTADEFYKLEKNERRRHLRKVLEAEPPPLVLHRLIREHWIVTVGHSFPSGHAFASMFFASFFLAMGLTLASTPRRRLFFLLLPWAACVAFSRVVLCMHGLRDVVAGSFIGMLFGFLAFTLVRSSMRAIARNPSLS